MLLSVPTCFHTQYTAGTLHTNDDASPPEPPESILVLEDLRPMGYRVKYIFSNASNNEVFTQGSYSLQSAHFKKGLSLIEAECAVTTISVVHALSLGLKLKEKVNLNERYPVSIFL